MKNVKIFLILLPLFAFVFVACRDNLGTYDGNEVYSDSNIGFEIVPPEGWYESGIVEGGNFVTFINSEGDTEPGIEVFHSYIGITSDYADELSFSEYMQNAKDNSKDVIPDLEYLGEVEMEIDGLPAELVTVRLEEGEVEVVKMQLLVMKSNTVYIVTGTSLALAWDKNTDEIKNSLLSFTFDW